ncbi:MAG: enoyl-CoA hydratase/isomerase family protein [Phreatobacter sp.]|uniref:enoyl-CoA hydratase-related protein n=1 Tax=Phreatobacter sp. TaxID=1966341 RepID=UPI001A581B56|nr:enoyl-CoA hydratase-related protein [Phreatobacter sp.]MBL8568959.1 enoyl-CoA hydratase/isomerase family protein [Phreatobacter sp.]
MTDHVSITRQDNGVVLVRMTRLDKKNALTGAMYDTMRGVIENAAAEGTRAVVFAGGPGVFTSGNDIADFVQRSAGGAKGSPAGDFIKALATVEVPMIAAVDGLAIGVGTTMMLHMDLAYASPNALFRMPFVDLGLVPEAASSLLFPRLAGIKKATEYIMLAEPFGAKEAEAIGLVNQVVTPEELEAKALAAAAKLAAKPPQALAHTRRLLRKGSEETRARMDEEGALFAELLRGDEAKGAFMAFMTRK